MAKVFLDVDETGVNIANDGDEVFGQTGDESVNILAGVTGVVLDGNIEAATLDGNVGDYLFQQQGNQLLVYSGAVLVATIPVQTDENGTQLTFDNGTFTAEFGEGAVLNIDGEDVPTEEPGPVTPPIGDTFTLAEAVALGEDLPEEYTIQDVPGNLFDGEGFAEGAEAILDGAAVIDVTEDMTVAQYDLIDGLATFDVANLAYTIADFWDNLWPRIGDPVLEKEGLDYEITEGEGYYFGRISEEEEAFIQGASNYVEGYWDYDEPIALTFDSLADARAYVEGQWEAGEEVDWGNYRINDTMDNLLANADVNDVMVINGAGEVNATGDSTIAQIQQFQDFYGWEDGEGNVHSMLNDYNLSDTAENLLNEDNAAIVEGADSFGLAAPITVAEYNDLVAQFDQEFSYEIADTLENLAAADEGVLDGADSYSLTDEAGYLGNLTEEESAIVDLADNAADYRYGEVTLAIDDVSVTEGDAGTVTATFTVTLNEAPGEGETVTVDYATADVTATADTDYVAATGTLTFAEGETTKTIEVTVNGDTVVEGDETFNVVLSNVTGTITGETPVIPEAPGVGTITNDDEAGGTFTLTTATDTLIGTENNDTFTGEVTTYSNDDQIIDVSTTDSDTYNLTVNAAATPNVTNVENINVNMMSVSPIALDASSITGADVLTVSRGDVTIGGNVVPGNKAVEVDNADSANMTKIVAGAGTTTFEVNAAAADKAGLIIDATNATGNVLVDGAATIYADNVTSANSVKIDSVSNTSSTETAKATVINAAKAGEVETHLDLTGSVTINATAAKTITVNDAQGGATINGGDTSTADTTITVKNIDDTGATITTGTGSSVAAEKQITIDLDGTAATSDAASIVAGGTIALDVAKTTVGVTVDALTLSGNGSAVTYNIAATQAEATSFTKAGTDSVTLAGNEARFSGLTVTDFDELNLNAGTAGTIAASKWTNVSNVKLGFDNAGNAITVKDGTKWTLTSETQTGLDFDFATGSTTGDFTLVSGDVNGSSNAAVGTATVGALDIAAGATVVGTVTIEAYESNFTATGTVLGAKQNLMVTGDEDVTLGAVTADSVDGSASTGIITLTMAADVDTVTTGSGADVVTVNGAAKHTLATGSGNDTITITDTNDESSFDAGAGNDTIHADKAGKVYVINGGDGDDTVRTGGATLASKAYLIGGNGTDTLLIDADAAANFAANTEFTITGFEKLNLSTMNNTMTVTSTQFAGMNSVEITDDGGATLKVTGDTTTTTIDASGLTLASGSTINLVEYTGSDSADTITGGVISETFVQSKGADSIVGGSTGTDTYQVTASLKETGSTETATGSVVNLGSSALTGTQVFAGIGKYLGDGVSSVAANTVAYAYDSADSSTINNSAVVDSVSGIENVTGSTMADFIVGDANNNVIDGGAGADYIDGGDGNDTITGGTGADTLNGGAGDDSFVYAATADLFSGNKLVDDITGGADTDSIVINNNGGAQFTIAAADAWSNTDNGSIATVEKIEAMASDQVISITANNDMYEAGITEIDLSGDTDATADNVINVSNEDGGANGYTITGSAGTDEITGGAGADTINGGAGDDVISGGAGIDSITLGTGNDLLGFAFTSGGDNIVDFSTAAAAVAATTDKIGLVMDLEDEAVAALAAFTGLGGVGTALDAAQFGTIDDAVAGAITATLAGDLSADTNVVIELTGAGNVLATATEAGFFAKFGDGQTSEITGVADMDVLFITYSDATATADASIFRVNFDGNVGGTDTTVDDAAEVTLIGTLADVGAGNLAAGDFVIA